MQNMNKSITIINQDSGYLMVDIANAFSKAGYEVSFITGRLVELNTPLDPSIKLDKIVRYRRSNMLMRLISWFTAISQISFKVWFKYRRSHLFIVSNPPFAPLIPLVCTNSYSLLFFDIYIEEPEYFKIIGNLKFLINLWKKAHKKVLVKADKIFTLTKGMKRNIEKYSGGKSVLILPEWTDNEFLKPIPHGDNPFIKNHQLEGKFIVLYSGNIGVDSGVENIIDAASLVNSDIIRFVIIGEGARKKDIINKIKSLNLNNCLVLPWQDPKGLPFSMASANLAVVSLSSKSSKYSIPSKIYNYMSVGAPILCLADQDSDISDLVKSKLLGQSFVPSQSSEIAEFIIHLANDPGECSAFAHNSLQASKEYSSEHAKKLIV